MTAAPRPRARLRSGRADGLDADRPGDHRCARDAVRQHERQQSRAGARQQHDRERPLRDQGAGGRSRPRGLLGRVRPDVRRPELDCRSPFPTDVPTAVPNPASRTAGELEHRLRDEPDRHPGAGLRRRFGRGSRHLRHGALDVIDDHQAGTDVLVVRHADRPMSARRRRAQLRRRRSPATCTCRPGLCDSDTTPYVFDTSGYTADARDELRHAGRAAEIHLEHLLRPRLRRDRGRRHSDAGALASSISSAARSKHQPPVALVEGIEAFRIEFGVDDLSKTGAAVDYTAAVNWADPLDRAHTDQPRRRRARRRLHPLHDRDLRGRRPDERDFGQDLRAGAQPRGFAELHGHQDVHAGQCRVASVPSTTTSSGTYSRPRCACRTSRGGGYAMKRLQRVSQGGATLVVEPDHAGADHADDHRGACDRQRQFPGRHQHAVPRRGGCRGEQGDRAGDEHAVHGDAGGGRRSTSTSTTTARRLRVNIAVPECISAAIDASHSPEQPVAAAGDGGRVDWNTVWDIQATVTGDDNASGGNAAMPVDVRTGVRVLLSRGAKGRGVHMKRKSNSVGTIQRAGWLQRPGRGHDRRCFSGPPRPRTSTCSSSRQADAATRRTC